MLLLLTADPSSGRVGGQVRALQVAEEANQADRQGLQVQTARGCR